MRMYRFILPLIALMLNSCLETEDPDVYNCIDTSQIVGIDVISKKRVREVKAYTDDGILCESANELLFRKNNDEQSYHYFYNEKRIDFR